MDSPCGHLRVGVTAEIDRAAGITVDAAGQAYVVGTTASPLFFGNVVIGTDAFVVKLAANGASIV